MAHSRQQVNEFALIPSATLSKDLPDTENPRNLRHKRGRNRRIEKFTSRHDGSPLLSPLHLTEQTPVGATSSHWQRHSITSSARASTVVGTSRPSALAVLRLITSSYLVGACTGRSAGF